RPRSPWPSAARALRSKTCWSASALSWRLLRLCLVFAMPRSYARSSGRRIRPREWESMSDSFATYVLLCLSALVAGVMNSVAGVGKEHTAPTARTVAGVVVFQFFVAVYGGYFGAGIGILMLSALGLMGFADIHRMNALKTLLAACINGVSVVVFVVEQKVEWPYALTMTVTAIIGGYLGARVARRLDGNVVRWVVVLIGLGLAAHFFYE